MDKKIAIISILVIIVLGAIAYSHSLGGQFIYDDEYLVQANSYIRSWSNFSKLFTENIGAGAGVSFAYYRPLQMVTYMIDYSLWKLDVRGYHLINIILHILTALCVWWFVRLLCGDWLIALIAGALFVVHPVNSETVNYISSRDSCLACLFTMIAFIFYIKRARSGSASIVTYGLMILSYVFAILSKENSLILPALLILYHFVFKEKIRLKDLLPIAALSVIYVVIRITVLKQLLGGLATETTLLQRAPGFLVAVTNYTRLLFFPVNLHMEYGQILVSFLDPRAITGVVILALALVLFLVFIRKNDRLIAFSIAWPIIAILPSSNLYSLTAYMAERWLYLPAIGFFIILAKALSSMYRKSALRPAAIILILVLVGSCTYLTIRQSAYWKNEITFYETTLKYVRDNYKMFNNLGRVYASMGRNEDAIYMHKRALEFRPDDAGIYNNIANAYSALGDTGNAIALYEKTLSLYPDFAPAIFNLANLYIRLGRAEEALKLYARAIELQPDNPQILHSVGIVYRNFGKDRESVACLKRAVDLIPDFAAAHYDLGLTYAKLGDGQNAMASYKKAIEADPNLGLAYGAMSIIYYAQKQYTLAVEYCDKAIKLGCNVDPAFMKALEPYR